MRVVVVVPTYNEVGNIEPLCRRLRAAVPGSDVVIVDDASPDGTADEVNLLSFAGSQFPGLLYKTDQLDWQPFFYFIGKIGNLGHLFILSEG